MNSEIARANCMSEGLEYPASLTAAERIQYESYLRRKDTNAAILRQAQAGISLKEIVRLTGHSRGFVRKVLRGQRTDVFRVR